MIPLCVPKSRGYHERTLILHVIHNCTLWMRTCRWSPIYSLYFFSCPLLHLLSHLLISISNTYLPTHYSTYLSYPNFNQSSMYYYFIAFGKKGTGLVHKLYLFLLSSFCGLNHLPTFFISTCLPFQFYVNFSKSLSIFQNLALLVTNQFYIFLC